MERRHQKHPFPSGFVTCYLDDNRQRLKNENKPEQDKASWVVNGGTAGAALTPSSIVANPQSFVGASGVPPIVANYDILYVQSKGSAI